MITEPAIRDSGVKYDPTWFFSHADSQDEERIKLVSVVRDGDRASTQAWLHLLQFETSQLSRDVSKKRYTFVDKLHTVAIKDTGSVSRKDSFLAGILLSQVETKRQWGELDEAKKIIKSGPPPPIRCYPPLSSRCKTRFIPTAAVPDAARIFAGT